MGTELARRGFELRAPLFASRALVDAPELVTEVHKDYLRAGADVITTNTLTVTAPALMRRAIELACSARDELKPAALVAANLGPIPAGDAELGELAAACEGADLILLETITSVAFATRALEACARHSALPRWLSFAIDDGGRLLDDSPLAELEVGSAPPELLAFNCSDLELVSRYLPALAASAERLGVQQIAVWPNLSGKDAAGNFVAVKHSDEALVAMAKTWRDLDLSPIKMRLVGTCCGSTPATTRALVLGLAEAPKC